MIDYKLYPKIEDYVMLSNSWFTQRAIFVVFGLLICALILASLIPFSNTIRTDFKITSTNPIIYIKSRASGHLVNSYLNHGDTIHEHNYVGFIEGDGFYKSVLNLEKALRTDSLNIESLDSLDIIFSNKSDIGVRLNAHSTDFVEFYSDYILLKDLKHQSSLEIQLENNISNDRNNINSKHQELEHSKVADQNSENIIIRYRKLFEKGVISKQDLDLKEKEFYNQVQYSKSLQSELVSLNSELAKSKFKRTNTLDRYSDSISIAFIQLKNAKERLLTEIMDWKNRNILISPKTGKIAFYNFDNNFKNVEIGDTICSVIPLDNNDLMGKSKIPIHNSSKILPEQRVIIKLDNYPSSEWGNLKGKVKTKSEIINYKDKIGYITLIDIDSNITTYGKEIMITQDMMGTAEIVLEETSVLQRILYRFKSIWLNDK